MTTTPVPPPPAPDGHRAGRTRMRVRATPMPAGTRTVVRLGGEIDMDSAGELETALIDVLSGSADGGPLVLDMSGVSFCDSTALRTLLRVRRLALRRHGSLSIASASDQVARLLDLTGTGPLFGFPASPGRPDRSAP
ncbi:STAS domain-containing protein [Streptomyces sp. NPDC058052]|uniref:STAS domain-containing protein n=1 Tax=Streptomyces sp. NPDC058052 TaxID=3346316 RepID=UPI0036EF36E7